ncbi:MAG: hypothetical protein PHC61_00055 [Chitinivibrionales bacterium]|nr:hypothetical protein [Chitinivibrionales bacterium]
MLQRSSPGDSNSSRSPSSSISLFVLLFIITPQKENNCMACPVYKDYNRMTGAGGKHIPTLFPEEERNYKNLMHDRMAAKVPVLAA